ncbi:MAG: hypothetical protein ABJF10_25370 [Chthoniobacter sp.]|uniref:hypothetical protein n=1 Tax=Chthoniobacter sp. TaxID=2510640 RepID=UPI0032A17350
MPFQFPPLSDKKRFPLLCSLSDILDHALMVCDDLVLYSPQESAAANLATRMPGDEWHLYGDTRWPSPAAWVEFPLTHHSFLDHGGVLVIRAELPRKIAQPFEWIAANHPLGRILPAMKSLPMAQTIAEMLESQADSDEVIGRPNDSRPAYVQSYCIYEQPAGEDDVRFVAAYTDLLNGGGIVIPRYRTGEFQSEDLSLCQFSLHALFRLNGGRISGMHFASHSLLPEFGPLLLSGDAAPPKWASFHPSRTLRTRPAVRALPSPRLTNDLMDMPDYEAILNVRRREANAHMLAFDRVGRPRDMALFNTDTNSTMAAYMHRAHGGAIYIIPERLVEEFHHTDCSEVRVGDIKLPFASVFLKFTPPEAVWLEENARVDGCYIGKQGDEFLFTLTSRLDGVDYEKSLSVACMDSIFALHISTSDLELQVNSGVQLGIEAFLRDNEPPTENFSSEVERPDGTIARVEDIRARSRRRRIERFRSQEPAFRACLNIIVNAACFITFRPDDVSDAWEGEPSPVVLAAAATAGETRRSRDRKLGAVHKIETGDFTRVKICGRDLFSDAARTEGGGADGKSPRAHWRRGHWRRQRHGPGLSLIVLRWIRPTIVMKDHGEPVETRIYEVEQ